MERERIAKILIVGDPQTGKSALLLRFSDNIFFNGWTSRKEIDFIVKTFPADEKAFKIQIWDTAGMERFTSITRSYYREAHAAILVYDITSKESFENLKKHYEEVKTNAPENIKFLLIGNKNDLETDRKVLTEEGKKYAEEIKAGFFETSAKNAENVRDAFKAIAKDAASFL